MVSISTYALTWTLLECRYEVQSWEITVQQMRAYSERKTPPLVEDGTAFPNVYKASERTCPDGARNQKGFCRRDQQQLNGLNCTVSKSCKTHRAVRQQNKVMNL